MNFDTMTQEQLDAWWEEERILFEKMFTLADSLFKDDE